MLGQLLEPATCLSGLRQIREALDADLAAAAVVAYAERYAGLAGRSPLEWRLVDAVVRLRPATPPLAWPEAMLDRPSGASLAFVLNQISGERATLPRGLTRSAPVAHPSRVALATAWRWRPDCAALEEPAVRQRFALWLCEAPEAIGVCLLAAAHVNDHALMERLGPLWIARGIYHAGAPQQIEQASAFADLRASATQALRTAFGLFVDDTAGCLHLLGAAFALRAFETAIAIGDTLLRRPEVAPEDRGRVLALLLGAHAALDHFEQTTDIYRDRWMPLGVPFPQPEWLLYAFQRRGELALERHLLDGVTAAGGASTSEWVRLRHALLQKGAPDRADLEAWEALYRSHERDEPVLVGVTDAVLRSAPLLQEEWRERLGLLPRWSALASHDAYRVLAGAYLVLLQPTASDRIDVFDQWLVGAPLSEEPVRRAARAYVAALRRTRQWQRLRDLSRRWPDLFDLACTFTERELARTHGRLIDLPDGVPALRRWCAGWERLLSLPLSVGETAEVLNHFMLLRGELTRVDPALAADPLLTDLELQVLRRGKAEAETRLAGSPDRRTADLLRARLRTARLEATLQILHDLDSLGHDHA